MRNALIRLGLEPGELANRKNGGDWRSGFVRVRQSEGGACQQVLVELRKTCPEGNRSEAGGLGDEEGL